MKLIKVTPIALVASMLVSNAFATEAVLNDVVVTASPMTTPVTVEMDPKIPRQPLPAHDGADFFKSVPGFSIMRKAGTDGELSFRGMGGSRVNILVDDQNIFGGCSGRMDAPTAYIFPEIYDKVTVVKGPQTVLYPGQGSAATIRFEKEPKTYDKPGYDVHASGLVGSFGRHDEVVDATTGDKGYFVNFAGSNSHSQDYKDGNGNKVHSQYSRYSASTTLGLTPDDNKRFELTALRSNGYADYADRTVDGKEFLRENITFRSQIKNVSNLIEKIDFQISDNYVDHTMQRDGTMGGVPMTVRHNTNAARVAFDLRLADTIKGTAGADYSISTHSNNGMSGLPSFSDDAELESHAVFAELTKKLSDKDSVVTGGRLEHWRAYDNAAMNGMSDMNPTRGKSRSDNLASGFARYESLLSYLPNAKAYAGLGRSERMPDYWELISNSSGQQFLTLKTEKTNQLDFGVIQKTDTSLMSASLFYNKIKDYLMVSYNSMGSSTGVSNVDATTYGGELSAIQYLIPKWKLGTSIAYTHGKNDTANTTLAQVAPLEGRISLNYEEGKFTHGGVLRLVAAKDKYDANNGGIAGYDIGKTGGFGVFSLNTTYKRDKRTTISAGIDNLFDKTYAEFISRTGSVAGLTSMGYVPNTRVNEPGRTAWLKATIALD
ncbi:MAG: copper transporter porin [Pseudomonadota bacterium]|jgi:iron complex outermembrane recepter protein